MKRFLFTALGLLIIYGTAFAQTQTEKLFQTMTEKYQANPLAELQKNASEDFVLISGSGYLIDKAKTLAIFKNVKNVEASLENLKLRQFGPILIATGKEHSVRHYNDGTPDYTTDYLVTYVYEIKDNRLILLSAQHTSLAK
ncbi:nuclear transport factor 2 family protein [Larkinella sp.]|uniref:nuclear transport factor 2 family protein n=1 Tax=Larkinella sp. TaxID=2034517 RepID=UPI003BADAFE9